MCCLILREYEGIISVAPQVGRRRLLRSNGGSSAFSRTPRLKTRRTPSSTRWWAALVHQPFPISPLPYIRAIVKEALRWSLTIPLGVPHVTSADDRYGGMFIPKGTLCFQSMRAVDSDPEVFGSDGARFDPARYLDENRQVKVPDGREVGHGAFGFGRHMCPGRHVAENTLGIDIARLLWAMRFERPEGVQAELNPRNFAEGGLSAYVVFTCSIFGFVLTSWHSHPLPFEYKVVPQFANSAAESMLKEALNLYE